METRQIQWAIFITGSVICSTFGSFIWGGLFLGIVAIFWSIYYKV